MGDCLRVSPERVGVIHFIGIGGIGMSGIAAILHAMGYIIRGSDIAENANVNRLRALGVEVFIGHDEKNIGGASVIVISSDIQSTNCELKAARTSGIPVVKRAEMLAELMRLKPSIAIAGSHGKTTVTSLMAHVMDACQQAPTIVCGGIIETMGTNARIGSGDWVVAEADESDGSFIKLPATISVVTSIDPEHMNYYKDFATLVKCFETFIHNIPFYGMNVMCFDHPVVHSLAENLTDRRCITYGLQDGADIRATNIQMTANGTTFDLNLNGKALSLTNGGASSFYQIQTPLLGLHNVQNVLAVFSVALELGLGVEQVNFALRTFKGIKRRFTYVGEVQGITIIDDYAHHPVEIERTLEAAKIAAKGRVIAVMQPHRYTRLSDLFDDFANSFSSADMVIITPVHAAGEQPIVGVDHARLAQEINGETVHSVDNYSDLVTYLHQNASAGDMVICMGAGSITQWAANLPTALEEAFFEKQKVGT